MLPWRDGLGDIDVKRPLCTLMDVSPSRTTVRIDNELVREPKEVARKEDAPSYQFSESDSARVG